MNPLKIVVSKKIATLDDPRGFIVCDNSDYQIEFVFDDEWDSHTVKTARFITGGGYQDVVFEGTVCNVPVIKNTVVLYVGVFAGSLRATTPATIGCKKSILRGGGSPENPPPDAYSQIMNMINAGMLKGDKGDKGDKGKDGAAGHTPEKGIDYYTPSDKAEIVNEVVDAVLADYEAYLDSLIAAQEATIAQMSDLVGD